MKQVLSWVVGFVLLFGILSVFASDDTSIPIAQPNGTVSVQEQNLTPPNTAKEKAISIPAKDDSSFKKSTTTIPVSAPNGTYTNTVGNEVPRPYYSNSVPAGASARCGDGTYSFSQSRRGTCSRHGGVAQWL